MNIPPLHGPTSEANAQCALAETLLKEDSVLKASIEMLRLPPLASETGLIETFRIIPLFAISTAEYVLELV